MIDTQSIFRSQGIDPYLISRVDAIDDGDYVIIWGQIRYKGKRLSNGPIEGINSRIKALKKSIVGILISKDFLKGSSTL